MKKRIFSMFLTLVLVLSFSTMTVFAADPHVNHDDVVFDIAWGDDSGEENSLPTSTGNYYLTEDITVTSKCNISGANINICLNGHVINLSGISGNNNISLQGSSTLSIYDCSDTIHYFTVDNDGLWTLTDSVTEHFVTGGVITGGHCNVGGAIYMDGSGNILNLNGGNIVGNKAANGVNNYEGDGGAIYCDVNSTFNMYGGKIIGNISERDGGAVFLRPGTGEGNTIFNMFNGEISNNKSAGCGGAVALGNYSGTGENNDRIFNMSGGTIKDNTTGRYGGGVCVIGGHGVFNMSGSATITENKVTFSDLSETAGGGGVYISDGSFLMKDYTSISRNESANFGGGVFISSGSFLMKDYTSISYNKSVNPGGGVYVEKNSELDKNSEFNMQGSSLISKNTSEDNGGGVAINNSIFNMKDNSQIEGNISNNGSGGVRVNSTGTFTMSDNSRIFNNKGANTGGVNFSGATFELKNGQIDHNEGTTCGGVTISSSADFIMTGGLINYNSSDNIGGVQSLAKSFTMTGGSIDHNTGNALAGGLFISATTTTLGGTAKITDNVKGGEINDIGELTGGEANNALVRNKLITLGTKTVPDDPGVDAPKSGFKVGISAYNAPTDGNAIKFTTNGQASDVQYFTSDASNSWVRYNSEGYLELFLHDIHTSVKVNGQDPTEQSAGFKSYFKCTVCDRFFEDEACEVQIIDLDKWKAEGGNGYIPPLNNKGNDDPSKQGDDPSKQGQDPSLVKTGDNSQMTLWVMLLAISSTGLGTYIVLENKKKKEQ